ncbi:RNA-splicing ligase RtcB [Candidatus Pacearchaeota archaeon CG_4_9_14_3_um_filter_31_7]|nr:MAG: RNA-splicing ligase RtcB [Candidatus Pacearchaeota archaeon CG_4_9_14_3_um_filter_31_7]
MEIKKISEFVWKIEKDKAMKVPAIIYSSDKLIEAVKLDKTLEQAKNVAMLKGILKASYVMPDAHQGYGFPIGGVAAFDIDNGIVSPGGVGYDINCGVRILATNLKLKDIEKKKKELMDEIYNLVPVGVGCKSNLRLSRDELFKVFEGGSEWALQNKMAFKEDIKNTEESGKMKNASLDFVSKEAVSRGLPQLGTLGAGNHFMELQKVDEIYDEKIAKIFGIEKGSITFMIHCGSRGIGHQIASDYIKEMEDKIGFKDLPDRELINADVNSELGQKYIKSMYGAVNYAFCNRQIIMHYVREAFNKVLNVEPKELKLIYDVAHNIAKIEEHLIDWEKRKVCLHRKGATRSFGAGHKEIPENYKSIGQPVLIPGSMGTASYLLVGTNESEELSFSSTAHGAGRVQSRTAALKSLRGEQVKSDLERKGIAVKAKSWKGLAEEAPSVYKNIDEVARVSDNLKLAKKVARLVPIAVIKG